MLVTLLRPRVERLTVLYDEDCGFCLWTVRQLRTLDRERRLEMMPLGHATHHPRRPDVALVAAGHDLRRSIHVLRDDGEVRQGGRAMLEILDVLPGGWLLRPWTLLPGVAPAVDAAYRLIAARRALLSRVVARASAAPCDLPHERGA
jgi:predicted DCC family thiol-disulfide oxidoreductase YuxK